MGSSNVGSVLTVAMNRGPAAVLSEGDSREDALRNIREAFELYLEPVEDDLAGKEGEIASTR